MDTFQYDTECYTAEKELPVTLNEFNIPSVDHSMSSMCLICYLKHAVVLFFQNIGFTIIGKIIYNLDIQTENQEESINKYDDNMMQNVFKNVISILVYVKRLDSKMDSFIQTNPNIKTNLTANNVFEKIFPFKNVEAVDDMENKLNLDEKTAVQLVFIYYNNI